MNQIKTTALTTLPNFLLIGCAVLLTVPASWLLAPTAAPVVEAQNPNNHTIRSTSHRPPLKRAQEHRRYNSTATRNRHLVSPTGDAANIPRSVYRQLDAPLGSGHIPIYYPQPYTHYVHLPPTFGSSRPAPPPPEPEPQRQQPPVVIINQPPAYPPPQPAPQPTITPREPPLQRPTAPQAVSFSLAPANAEVFLDEEPIGTAAEVAQAGDIELVPGVYILEVVHPTLRTQRLVFGVDEEPVTIKVNLAIDKPSRRARVQ